MSANHEPIGLVHGLGIREYHSGPGISKTGLDDMARSPAYFYAWHLDPRRPSSSSTIAQQHGNLAHCAILEPSEFSRRYSVGPDVRRNTKAWEAFEESLLDGQEAIKPDQRDAAFAQAASVRSDPYIASLLSKGRAEVSAYWRDPVTKVLCRCRPDWVHPVSDSEVILVDVKTYGDVTEREFSRQIASMGYHVQDRFYSDGYQIASGKRVVGFVFVAVEDKWPYAAAAYQLGEESRLEGFGIYRDLLDLYAHCLKTNKWPGFHVGVKTIELPDWAFSTQEVEITYA